MSGGRRACSYRDQLGLRRQRKELLEDAPQRLHLVRQLGRPAPEGRAQLLSRGQVSIGASASAGVQQGGTAGPDARCRNAAPTRVGGRAWRMTERASRRAFIVSSEKPQKRNTITLCGRRALAVIAACPDPALVSPGRATGEGRPGAAGGELSCRGQAAAGAGLREQCRLADARIADHKRRLVADAEALVVLTCSTETVHRLNAGRLIE